MYAGTPLAIAVKRDEIVTEAFTWNGTPFHDMAGVKGVGVDCAYFLVRVYSAVGLAENFDPKYKPQWFLHRAEPIFIETIERCGGRQIDPASALTGDVLMYSYGRHAAHGAIVVDERSLIHAYKPVGRVTRGDRGEFEGRLHSAWSVFP